jgi:hypothetical protein
LLSSRPQRGLDLHQGSFGPVLTQVNSTAPPFWQVAKEITVKLDDARMHYDCDDSRWVNLSVHGFEQFAVSAVGIGRFNDRL